MKSLRRVPRLSSIAAAACTLLFLAATGYAQSDLEKTLQQFGATEVKGYIQPLADLFGANMNAGMFHDAEIPRTGFHFSFELVGMGAMVGDNQKNYTLNSPAGFNPATFSTATMFGGKRDSVVDTKTNLKYFGIADGFVNTSIFPLGAPQVTIGDIYGTRAIIRLVATPSMKGFPSATLWGLGLQHSISQYVPAVPVDIAAHLFYSQFRFGDVVSFNGTSIGVEASKSLSVLRLYGGLAWEKSSMEVKYTPGNATSPAVDITMNGANNFRATIGLGLHLAFFSIFADANFGSVTNFSAGIGFGG
jgi:hypothetical protein